MDMKDASNLKQKPVAPQDLQGRFFYRPGVVATYCVLSLPVGLYLYGLNVARRGGRVMGYAMAGVSGAVLVGMLVAGAIGARVPGVGILGILVGIGLLNMEDRPYRVALSRGGLTARWWPPLLYVLGSGLLLVMIATVFGQAEILE